MTSHDPPPEAVHHLAVAHCVVGRVLTIQGKYPHKILNVLSFLSHVSLSLVTRPLQIYSHGEKFLFYLQDKDNKLRG